MLTVVTMLFVLHARTLASHVLHGRHTLGIKLLFLLGIQLGIKSFCGLTMFLHERSALCPHGLHLVNAFRRCHFFKHGVIRTGRVI